MFPKRPQTPHTRPLAETLGRHPGLMSLLDRLQASQARLQIARRALPPAMRPLVQTGVLDAEGWNLLVPNGAVAAKLRQCLPLIRQALIDAGHTDLPLRVRIASPEPR